MKQFIYKYNEAQTFEILMYGFNLYFILNFISNFIYYILSSCN